MEAGNMRGQDLYQLLFNSLDLPESVKASYLENVLKKYSITSEELTIEILREIVADFLQETILELDQTQDQSIVQNQ
jgi:hypothetical protein